jgi:hypothetical protein
MAVVRVMEIDGNAQMEGSLELLIMAREIRSPITCESAHLSMGKLHLWLCNVVSERGQRLQLKTVFQYNI